MVALPEKLLAGTKLKLPFGFTLTVPWPGCDSTAPVTVKVSPSTSRSLASTSMVSGVLIGVAARSSANDGASVVPLMATVTTAELPSMLKTAKVSLGRDWPDPSACTAGSALFSR